MSKNDAAATTQDYGYQLMHALGTISNNIWYRC